MAGKLPRRTQTYSRTVPVLKDGQGRTLRPGATVRDDGYEIATLSNPMGNGVDQIFIDTLQTTRNLQLIPDRIFSEVVVGYNTAATDQRGWSNGFFGVFYGSGTSDRGLATTLSFGGLSNWVVSVWALQNSVAFPGKRRMTVIEIARNAGAITKPPVSTYNSPGFSWWDTVTGTEFFTSSSGFVETNYLAGSPGVKSWIIWEKDNIALPLLTIGRKYWIFDRDISGEVGTKTRRTQVAYRRAPAAEYGLRWDRPTDTVNEQQDGKPLAFKPR
jgi:hypothetical protein